MTTKKNGLFAICLLFSAAALQAQTLIDTFSFDSADDFAQWTTANGTWKWVEDGKAEVFDPFFWNDRSAIRSKSGGGAVALASNEGLFDRLVSPEIELGEQDSVYLRFNEYFRKYSAITQVTAANLLTGDELVFNLHTNVPEQVETSYRAEQVLDISAIAASDTAVLQIAFLYEGSGYFWIIDDVELHNSYPYPETRPAHYRDTLSTLGYPYASDDAGWPYHPSEIVVQIEPGADPGMVEALRDTLGATLLESCVCNTLQLWGLGDSILYNQGDELFPSGSTIGILERVKGASSSVVIQEADPNYYTIAQLQDGMVMDNPMLTQSDLMDIPDAVDDAIRIAVLDTGVDYKHDSLEAYIYKKPDGIGNSMDDDANCATDDPIGWDFVAENVDISNNPLDDHGHGTHVAGIIAKTLDQACTDNCRFQIIPYKTHDARGVSSLFKVACATYQAIEDSVSVINDSWGFYGSAISSDSGDGSGILKNAIDSTTLNNILVVSAAGNDSIMLDTLLQYPACYVSPNEITVGAVFDTTDMEGVQVWERAPFSNFSATWVDILAPGVNISSYLPQNNLGEKSGTSMSAPAVSAAAAIVYCKLGRQAPYAEVKSLVLSTADEVTALDTVAFNGRLLNIPQLCLTPTAAPPLSVPIDFYPNPARDAVLVELPPVKEAAALEIFHLSGQRMGQWPVRSSASPQTMTLDIAHLPAGSYLLRLRHEGQQWVGRLLKL